MSSLPAVLVVLALAWPAPHPPPSLLPIPTARAPTIWSTTEPVPSTGTWPIDPHPVVRGFDPPETPWDAAHRGVDLAGRPGQPVRAALAGTVTFAGTIAGRGVVVVDHGGFRTTYEPVVAGISVGDRVDQGGTLGVLEVAGTHCPPQACLHWGLREGDRYRDPLLLVGTVEVRLLPVA